MRTNRPKSRAGITLVRLLLVTSICGAVVVGLVLPQAHRLPWLNHLKQQALSVTSYLGAFRDLSSFRQSPGVPWQRQNSPYLQHQGLSDGYSQPATGTLLPWQSQNSPYVEHQGL